MSVQAFDIELAGNLSTLIADKQPFNSSVLQTMFYIKFRVKFNSPMLIFMQITCLEVCGDILFVGCKDGCVFYNIYYI